MEEISYNVFEILPRHLPGAWTEGNHRKCESGLLVFKAVTLSPGPSYCQCYLFDHHFWLGFYYQRVVYLVPYLKSDVSLILKLKVCRRRKGQIIIIIWNNLNKSFWYDDGYINHNLTEIIFQRPENQFIRVLVKFSLHITVNCFTLVRLAVQFLALRL